MTKRGSPKQPKVLWTATVPAVAAIVALVLSLISLYQSYSSQKVAQESNDIARTAQANDSTQVARELKAKVQNWLFVARSPDLRALEDKDWYQVADLKPQVISTAYQQNALVNYSADLNRGYLFVVIVNYGPSDVEKLSFLNFEWKQKQGDKKPVGVEVTGEWGPLEKGYFYAILVDVLEPLDGRQVWTRANYELARTNYSAVYIEATYQDGITSNNPIQIGLGDQSLFPTTGSTQILPPQSMPTSTPVP